MPGMAEPEAEPVASGPEAPAPARTGGGGGGSKPKARKAPKKKAPKKAATVFAQVTAHLCKEIVEHQRTGAALRQTEARFRQMAANLPEGMIFQ